MQRVFISNAEIQEADNISIDSSDDINNLSIDEKYKNGDFVFIIDVHCAFKESERMQQQGGVTIYRHLLKQFKDCQDKLKVIFYSPISSEQLISLRPENYVLKLLPVVELFPEKDEDGNIIDNWDFEEALKTKINDNNFFQFNNASENLLSGWALANEKEIKKGKFSEGRIKLNGWKVLIVDDEFSSWMVTYSTIFDDPNNILFPPYSSQTEFRQAWKENKALDFICDGARDADFVLSDLYIEESHEETKPYKKKEEIEDISGFKLLKKIKEKYPYLPYMLFTSSNKVWNAETFRSEGIWSWAVKENSENTDSQDKIAQFEHFRNSIAKITNPEWQFVVSIWKNLIDLELQATHTSFWWSAQCTEALDILKDCLRTLDSIYSQRGEFETKNVTDFEGRQCLHIINNLGGICELLKLNFNNLRQKTVGMYIYQLRSFYSHKLFYKVAKPLEAIFCIDLLLKLLSLNSAQLQLESSEIFVIEQEFVKNSNVNYFLQFRYLVQSGNNISHDGMLFTGLEAKFATIKTDIISNEYTNNIVKYTRDINKLQENIAKNQRVIQLEDAHKNAIP